MADNQTGLNAQYDNPPFSMSGGIGSTGAPGSPGDTVEQTGGPVIASPAISIPFASSQIAANRPTVPVTSGDTSAMSSDQPIGDNFTLISGASADAMSATGAGQGSDITAGHHPNAAGR